MMTRPVKVRPLWAILGLAVVIATATGAQSVDPRQPSDTSRCPVCGMLVARHGAWLAQIVPADGEALFFDGAKDLFRFLLDPERADEAGREMDAETVFVTAYYDGKAIRAREAYFVIGSEVLGPMGAELVPHASREAAEEFRRDHGGSAVLRFDAVGQEILAGLR